MRKLEDHGRAGVVDREVLDVEGSGVEVGAGRVGVVAGPVVVVVGIVGLEDQLAGGLVEDDRARDARGRLPTGSWRPC